MTLTTDEYEMHIWYSPSTMGKTCEIYTTIPYMVKALKKLATEHSDECTILKEDECAITISAPLKYVKPRVPRKYSEEQKKLLAERLRKARENG
jgi:hypothetical protein